VHSSNTPRLMASMTLPASERRTRALIARSRTQNLLVIHPTLHLFGEKAVDELVPLDRPQASKLLQAPYPMTFRTLHTRTDGSCANRRKGAAHGSGCAAMRLLVKMFALPR
jgi:hypothetical protein